MALSLFKMTRDLSFHFGKGISFGSICKRKLLKMTLLHIATRYDCEALITWLIDKIANTDLAKEMDETPLIVTTKHRQLGYDDPSFSTRLFNARPHVLGQEPPHVKT